MFASRAVFIWSLVVAFSFLASADDKVSILVRATINLSDTFAHHYDPEWAVKWPKVHAYVSELVARGITSSLQLNVKERTTLGGLLREDSRSWGHLTIELPGRPPEIYGFHPDPPNRLPFGHPLTAATSESDYVNWLRQELPIPASFHRNEEWLNDPNQTQPVYRIDIPVTDSELNIIRRNFDRLQADPRVQYRLPLKKELPPHCYNCMTAVGELFTGTAIPVSFLKETYGQINSALAGIQQIQRQGDPGGCHFRLNRLSGGFIQYRRMD